MRGIFRIIGALGLAAVLAAPLGGCSTTEFGQKIQGAVSAITGATVDPQSVIIASNIFDGLQKTGENYLTLVRCNGANGPICRDPKVTKQIVPAIRSGRVARNNLQQFLIDHPGQLGPKGLMDTLQASIDTLQSVYAQYNVGAVQ